MAWMRNYKAMGDTKLRQCLDELEKYRPGMKIDYLSIQIIKAKGGDIEENLAKVKEVARERGMISEHDEIWEVAERWPIGTRIVFNGAGGKFKGKTVSAEPKLKKADILDTYESVALHNSNVYTIAVKLDDFSAPCVLKFPQKLTKE